MYEQVKDRHGAGQPGVDICPHPMHDLLDMDDKREHRQHSLDAYMVVPRAPSTQCEVAQIALGGMEGGIAQDIMRSSHCRINP